MNLNLSMAMVITVREDMKAATMGMVRVILEGARRLYALKSSIKVEISSLFIPTPTSSSHSKFIHFFQFINSKLQEICSSYLQNISCWGNGNCLLSLSWMMKGRQRPSRRSDKARLKMKMFRPVLMALLVITAMRTIMLFTTRIFEISHWLINGLWLNWLYKNG